MLNPALLEYRATLPARPDVFDTVADHSWKRVFDVTVALALMPLFAAVTVVLLGLNPLLNRGPLFFVQPRMGRHRASFDILKFRTMRSAEGVQRRFDEEVEHDRITALGGILRRSRIDELPQIVNVLRGEMSFIGPRPDYYDFALQYCRVVEGYAHRFSVKPGITGYAQVKTGYAEGLDAVRDKAAADLVYIARASTSFELWILWQTVLKVAFCRGK